MFSTIEEEKAYNLAQQSDEKFHIEDESNESRKMENKFKDKYQISAKPLASNFLQKRLQRGQKFFDSGDYNMAIANKNKLKLPSQMKELKENNLIVLESQKGQLPSTPSNSPKEPKSDYDTKMPLISTIKKQDDTLNPASKEKHLADNEKLNSNVMSDAMISPRSEMPSTDITRNASLEPSETSEATGHVIPTPENVPARKASIPLSTVLLKAQQPHQLTFPFHHAG